MTDDSAHWGQLRTAVIAAAIVGVASVASVVSGSMPAHAARTSALSDAATADVTSRVEARRVDRVTATPDWFDCSATFGPRTECASVELPLDYDRPRGTQTDVAMLRIKANGQKGKLGTLFVNPGGPGASGVLFAADAPFFLSPSVLARFDVVGFDPRGINFSANVRCWKSLGAQSADISGLQIPFPYTSAEERAAVSSAKKFGRACSASGNSLTAHMSTAQVARDMDVLRRVVGDPKLSYLGFSYGSYLGNVYANLFPDRIRAVTLDGVLDPIAWSGTVGDTKVPQTMRLRSGEAASRALDEILRRCARAGPDYCALAAAGDPRSIYTDIVAALKAEPLQIPDPDTGEVYFELTYATAIEFLLGDLYEPDGSALVDNDLSFAWFLLQQRAAPGSVPQTELDRAANALVARLDKARAADDAAHQDSARGAPALGEYSFPYDNGPDSFASVLCTDGRNSSAAGRWPHYADRADTTAPGFGPLWTWTSAPCAARTWTVRDDDAYTGPFSHRTAVPVLVVGNFWDPATSYHGAVTAASLLPNSRLLSSNSWGHTAYGTSECVTRAVDRYLLTAAIPAPRARCTGDVQPFTERLAHPGAPDARRSVPQQHPLPPVVPPLPGAVPRR